MRRRKPGLLVVTEPLRAPGLAGIPTTSADSYLEGKGSALEEDLTVINLCRSYGYLSKGYYVSLLADARHQRAYPDIEDIEEVTNRFAYLRTLREAGVETLDLRTTRRRRKLVPKSIVPEPDAVTRPGRPGHPLVIHLEEDGLVHYHPEPDDVVEITCVLGKTLDKRFRRTCSTVFKAYGCPLLRVRMYYEDEEWKVGRIQPVSLGQIGPGETELLREQLTQGKFAAKPPAAAPPRPLLIACLWDEEDKFAPSTEETIDKFARIAARHGILFETIGRNDLGRLAEHDALFIRTNTAINHYSFAFAQAADSLGIPVIDDPQSTLRCSNKVYLHQLFRKNGVPIPQTMTISRKTPPAEIETLGFPLILKLPDGTFSSSVKKAADRAEFDAISQEMFKQSPLLIVQEFIPTPFDWRIGILENQVLFACKYHMVKHHWQIVSQPKTGNGNPRYGRVEAVPIGETPEEVRRVALEAAALIGNGLYGVDVKDSAAGPVIIEVNDNPNIDAGLEDAVEKDRIYDAILQAFVRRIQEESSVVRAS